MRRLFGLTRAEQELANGLLEGLSLEDIATRRAVRIGTLKVQLRTLLAKTGARRQSDLLRRLAPFARLRSEPVVRRPLHRATIGT